MPLLTKQLKTGFAKPSTGGNYLNPSQVSEGDKLRFTILGDDSLVGHQCWVDGEGGKRALRFGMSPMPATSLSVPKRLEPPSPKTAPASSWPSRFGLRPVSHSDLPVHPELDRHTKLIAYLSEEELLSRRAPHL